MDLQNNYFNPISSQTFCFNEPFTSVKNSTSTWSFLPKPETCSNERSTKPLQPSFPTKMPSGEPLAKKPKLNSVKINSQKLQELRQQVTNHHKRQINIKTVSHPEKSYFISKKMTSEIL